jgi:hypothetical protein
MMKKILSFIEHIVLLLLLVLLCYREAFPGGLSTACELKEYHLNGVTLFLSKTRPALVKFWDSGFAPVCHDDAAKQTQVESETETDADVPTDSCGESLTLDNVLEWTRNFATFSNTVLEESVLPRLPFFTDKIKNVTKLIADSWNPEAIKMQVYETWTNTLEPRIPVSVLTAWDNAFASREEEVISHHHDAAPTNTTTEAFPADAEDLDDEHHVDVAVDVAIAFCRFAMDTVTSSAMYKMAVTTPLQVMKDCPELLSQASDDTKSKICFGLLTVYVFMIWLWCESQRARIKAEIRQQAERRRQAEDQRRVERQRQAVRQHLLEGRLQDLGELTRTTEPRIQLIGLAHAASLWLKDEPGFERLRALDFERLRASDSDSEDSCASYRIIYVTLRHVFNPKLNPLSSVSLTMRNRLTELYHLTKVVGEARGLLQPVDPDLNYFVKTSMEAVKWRVTKGMLDELFGPFQLEQLFDTYKRSLENHQLVGSEAELLVNLPAQAAGSVSS